MTKKVEEKLEQKKGNGWGGARPGTGGAMPGAGRKPFVPTDEERKKVADLAGYGLPMEQIAILIRDGIHMETLRKYFKKELVEGKARANADVGLTLYQKAVGGDTAAIIWWTKTQMRWIETHKLDHTSSDGSMTPKSAIDVTKLSTSALEEILKASSSDDNH